MKGGFNNPPNPSVWEYVGAGFQPSMKGGFNNPPNPLGSLIAWPTAAACFNEGGVQ